MKPKSDKKDQVTSLSISWRDWFRMLKFDLRQKLGLLTNNSLGISFKNKSKVKQKGRLSSQDISQLKSFQESKLSTPDSAQEYLNKAKVNKELLDTEREFSTFQINGARLLDQTLSKYHNSIKSVANIGSRLDTISSYLSSKYSEINFWSIDFQENISQCNHFVLPPKSNWNFRSGYALEILERKEVSADVYFMTSTSILFNNKELDLYFSELSKSAKFIVLNEPWFPKAKTFFPCRILRPEQVNPMNPYCGGMYMNYHHNYIKKLEDNGFKILKSEIFPLRHSYACNLQLIAAKII
ncbi:hypothetical protein [Synechococcus sp. NOUM97013]|uniref:hypothetical protein n=1 Tax=Synechococcus sp. NOUM97013 TaxID=1442555 RepID=UPI001644975C|nr:hypothetical protein [Synechococcus sp. NOUM97013]QNI73044.1 hypothetical protein SynNOUM97013_00977 [Synechococcus sp. NOUM97013]